MCVLNAEDVDTAAIAALKLAGCCADSALIQRGVVNEDMRISGVETAVGR